MSDFVSTFAAFLPLRLVDPVTIGVALVVTLAVRQAWSPLTGGAVAAAAGELQFLIFGERYAFLPGAFAAAFLAGTLWGAGLLVVLQLVRRRLS